MTSPATAPADATPPSAAETELLALLAYAELTAFTHTARAAHQAPDTAVKVALARMAVVEFANYERLADRLATVGTPPEEAMAPFAPALREFHDRTEPGDWLEGLVKAYVGDGIARDFYREVASRMHTPTGALIEDVLAGRGHDDVVVALVQQAVAEDARIASRLALWARRIVGEAIAQAQREAVEHDALAGLIVGGPQGAGFDLASLGELITRLTEAHARRMGRLGLRP